MISEFMKNRIDAEIAALGSVLLDPSKIHDLSEKLAPIDFSIYPHQAIYGAMLALNADGTPIDIVTVKNRLEKDGTLEPSGGTDYLCKLTDLTPTANNADHYATEVQRTAFAARLIKSCEDAIGMIAGGNFEEARDDLSAFLVSCSKSSCGVKSLKQAVKDAHESGRNQTNGVTTGYIRLDNALSGGVDGTSVTVIAAGTSVGKTQLGLNIARRMRKEERPARALLISLEMGEDQLVDRLTAMESGINLGSCKDRRMQKRATAAELSDQKYLCGIRAVTGYDHWIYDSGALTPSKLRGIVAANASRIDAVILDYLQLMGSDARGESDYQRVSAASRCCKNLARQFKIPFFVLAQLSRAGKKSDAEQESSTPAIPQMHHLRDSGQIEQDADNILMLWREKRPKANAEELRVYIRKNRNGPIGKLRLNMHLPTGDIQDFNEDSPDLDEDE